MFIPYTLYWLSVIYSLKMFFNNILDIGPLHEESQEREHS
jgi:hypothetical protein